MPFPFDSKESISQWVRTAFDTLGVIGEPLNLKEYFVIAKSSPWALAVLSLGGFIPSASKAPIEDLVGNPAPSMLRRKRRSQSQMSRSPSNPPPDASNSMIEKMREMKRLLKESEERERQLKLQLEEALKVNAQSVHVDEESDEWTDSEEATSILERDEPSEEQNVRLLAQVRTLQAELRKYVTNGHRLRKEKRELIDKNGTLRVEMRQLQKLSEVPGNGERSRTSSFNRESPLFLPTEPARNGADVPADVWSPSTSEQLDSYYSMLCWTLQANRISPSPDSDLDPVPPGKVQKVDVVMKRGDFIQNWKKRLIIATDTMVHYYLDPMKPRGSIELRTVRAVREADSSNLPLTLEILTPQRIWALSFSSRTQMQEWNALFKRSATENARRIAREKELRLAQEKAALEYRKQNAPLNPSKGNDSLWSF